MELSAYRIGDRIELRTGTDWSPGIVIAERVPGFPLQVKLDASPVPKIVSDSTSIRLAMAGAAFAAGMAVSINGEAGDRWSGEIVRPFSNGVYAVRLNGFGGQPVVIEEARLEPR